MRRLLVLLCCACLNASAADSLALASRLLPKGMFTVAGRPRATLDGAPITAPREPRPWLLLGIGGGYAAALTTLHIIQRNAWWKEPGPFQVVEDWHFALQVDKAGHLWGGYAMSYLSGELLLAAGVSPKNATLMGSLIGLLYQTYVELEDGFSRDWGFSPSDEIANFLGAYWYLAQHYWQPLQAFQLRWQYVPARWTGERPRTHGGTFIDDYNSSSFWLSIDLWQLLPQRWRDAYPEWLMLSIGYGVRNIETGLPPERRYMLGLDYNLAALLPEGAPLWNWLRQSLMLFKLPAPAVEFGPHPPRFHLLYPFRIRLGQLRL
jgi:hypothetical protein